LENCGGSDFINKPENKIVEKEMIGHYQKYEGTI